MNTTCFRSLGFGMLLSVSLSACTSTYIVRRDADSSVGTSSFRDYTVYCNDGDSATGGGCGMGVPTNGWTVNICDPIGLSPSGNPNISPGTGQKAIGWRIGITGPSGTTPSSAAVFAVCADR